MKPKQIFNIILLMVFLMFGLNSENLYSTGESFTFTEISEVRPDTTRSENKRSDTAGRISIIQQGSGNTATVRQSGGTDGTTEASVRMTGSGNTTELSFNGNRGDAKIDMAGDDNLLLIRPLSVFDIFTLQISKKPSVIINNDEAADDFLMIFRNLEDTLEIHQ